MITFDVSVTGGQVASALLQDPEETAYFLADMASTIDGDDAREIMEHLPYGSTSEIAEVFELLAKTFRGDQ